MVCPVEQKETEVEVNGDIGELVFIQMDKNELKQFEKKGLFVFCVYDVLL